MNTSEILNRAADLIEQHGWTKGNQGWNVDAFGNARDTAELCLEGGIAAALNANPYDHEFRHCPAYEAMRNYLQVPARALWMWNDIKARTSSEVIEVLRACAVIEEARERQAVEVTA